MATYLVGINVAKTHVDQIGDVVCAQVYFMFLKFIDMHFILAWC